MLLYADSRYPWDEIIFYPTNTYDIYAHKIYWKKTAVGFYSNYVTSVGNPFAFFRKQASQVLFLYDVAIHVARRECRIHAYYTCARKIKDTCTGDILTRASLTAQFIQQDSLAQLSTGLVTRIQEQSFPWCNNMRFTINDAAAWWRAFKTWSFL